VTDAAQHVTEYACGDENNLVSISDATNHTGLTKFFVPLHSSAATAL
jgi:hypothetical protein